MKKFIFSMQSVLNMKLSLEKQHMAELGAADARLKLFAQQLDALHVRLEGQVDGFNDACARGVRPGDLTVYSIGFRAMREKIAAQRHKIEIAEQEKKRVQARLLEVMRERKMLEKLRERQIENHKVLVKAEEAAVMDDFMTNRIHQAAR